MLPLLSLLERGGSLYRLTYRGSLPSSLRIIINLDLDILYLPTSVRLVQFYCEVFPDLFSRFPIIFPIRVQLRGCLSTPWDLRSLVRF